MHTVYVPSFLLINGLLVTHQSYAGPYTYPDVGHTPGVGPVLVPFPVFTNLYFPHLFLTETFVAEERME
jgi:hypothetical protein